MEGDKRSRVEIQSPLVTVHLGTMIGCTGGVDRKKEVESANTSPFIGGRRGTNSPRVIEPQREQKKDD